MTGSASVARTTAFSAWNLVSSQALRNPWPASSSSSAMTPIAVPGDVAGAETWTKPLQLGALPGELEHVPGAVHVDAPGDLPRDGELVQMAARWKMSVTSPATRSTSSPDSPRCRSMTSPVRTSTGAPCTRDVAPGLA